MIARMNMAYIGRNAGKHDDGLTKKIRLINKIEVQAAF
jgi:hypothetical protein